MYVKHKFIKNNSLETRHYQEAILKTALAKNTLCVLPTGLGKTNIALLLSAHTLERNPEAKILFLAPTRPLVDQHRRTFTRFLTLEEEDMITITGVVKPETRKELYSTKTIIFATPQTIQNDLKAHRLTLQQFHLLIIDEIHHAIGRYAYPFIAQAHLTQSENPRILGLTASPGSSREKIKEICSNCGIEAVEIKSEHDEDVRPYVKTKDVEWVSVELPESFLKIWRLMEATHKKRAATLRKLGLLRGRYITRKNLLSLQADLIKQTKSRTKRAFIAP